MSGPSVSTSLARQATHGGGWSPLDGGVEPATQKWPGGHGAGLGEAAVAPSAETEAAAQKWPAARAPAPAASARVVAAHAALDDEGRLRRLDAPDDVGELGKVDVARAVSGGCVHHLLDLLIGEKLPDGLHQFL